MTSTSPLQKSSVTSDGHKPGFIPGSGSEFNHANGLERAEIAGFDFGARMLAEELEQDPDAIAI